MKANTTEKAQTMSDANSTIDMEKIQSLMALLISRTDEEIAFLEKVECLADMGIESGEKGDVPFLILSDLIKARRAELGARE